MSANEPLSGSLLPRASIELGTRQVEDLAAEDAVRGLPPPDAVTLTPTEQQIVDRCAEAYGQLNRTAATHIAVAVETFSKRPTLPTESDFNALERASEASLVKFQNEARQRLLSLNTDYLVATRHLAYFRHRHGLHRPARYPESTNLHLAMLVLFVLVEAVLNSFFLYEHNPLGLIGAILTAFFISIASVGLGYISGRFAYPYAAHGEGAQRWLGTLGVLGWLLVVALLHFVVAHYRDLSAQGDPRAMYQAIPHAFSQPFGLGVLSIVMFLIGTLLSLLAFVDGARWDDPIPGYGEVDRCYARARSAFDAAIQHARKEVTVHAETATLGSTRMRVEAERDLSHLIEVQAGVDPLRVAYDNERNHINDTCRRLLLIYRAKNRQIRQPLPVPPYFERDPEPLSSSLDLRPADAFAPAIQQMRATVEFVNRWDTAVQVRSNDRLTAAHSNFDGFAAQLAREAAASAAIQGIPDVGGGEA